MRIVLDTNVVVSALLRPVSIPARVLALILTRQVDLAVDHRIFAEYRAVLYRPEFSFPSDEVETILDFVWRSAEQIRAVSLPIQLPNPDDIKFVEVAVSALVDAIVTGNTRHFPRNHCHGVTVLSPRQFLSVWEESG